MIRKSPVRVAPEDFPSPHNSRSKSQEAPAGLVTYRGAVSGNRNVTIEKKQCQSPRVMHTVTK